MASQEIGRNVSSQAIFGPNVAEDAGKSSPKFGEDGALATDTAVVSVRPTSHFKGQILLWLSYVLLTDIMYTKTSDICHFPLQLETFVG